MSPNLGIRQRVLIITLLPLCLITLLLGSYFIHTRLDDAHTALINKGQTMAQMLAASSEFGILAGSTDILNGLIKSSIKSEEVYDIVFLNSSFGVITQGINDTSRPDKNANYPLHKDGKVYFLHPVIASGLDVLDSQDLPEENLEPETIGWVIITLSEHPTKARQKEIALKGTLLAVLGLLLTALIASRFGQRITNPVLGLTHVIKMLQYGNLETRASLSGTGELKSLAQGINLLAQRVQESNQSLKTQVDKATQKLRSALVHQKKQNQALIQARKQADSANLAKDEFLARMSHELRTPLTSVSGFAQLLDHTELHSEQKEYTRIINLTAGLLLSIIDDILDYSKLDSNAVELEEIQFDPESCIFDVLEMQTAAAHEKSLELIPVISPQIPKFLIGDPIRFKQILTNLISNAVKFTSEGHVCVQVKANNLSSIETELLIEVIDTGIGIPQKNIEHLFTAFSQTDTSITREYGGSGLGLIIAKRLTELMSGYISLQSKEGKGTTTSLKIPFPISPRQQKNVNYPSGTVIIYDRHPLVRYSLLKQLSSSGSEIIEACSFTNFLELTKERPHGDAILGLTTGIASKETIEQVRLLVDSHPGKIILLSGQPLPMFLGSNIAQLRKPPRTQRLLNALSPEFYKAPQQSSAQGFVFGGKPKILVAEDNDFNRLLINKILQHAGAEVIEASTGEEAVKITINQAPSLILMDVHMPVMDGIEATRQIRLTSPDIPIIALTANVVSSEHSKLLEAGANHVLLKPINDQELYQTINLFLSESTPLTSSSNSQSSQGTDISKYDISYLELEAELNKQLSGIMTGFQHSDIKQMRNHSHQLQGLAGLYRIPEIEAIGHNIHDALIEEDYRAIWKSLWQLTRIIEHKQFELSEPF